MLFETGIWISRFVVLTHVPSWTQRKRKSQRDLVPAHKGKIVSDTERYHQTPTENLHHILGLKRMNLAGLLQKVQTFSTRQLLQMTCPQSMHPMTLPLQLMAVHCAQEDIVAAGNTPQIVEGCKHTPS